MPIEPLSTDLPLEVLDQQEADCFFNGFNADIAFDLGCKLREEARKLDAPVLIQISTTNGVTFFQCCSRAGVIPDNEQWAIRKRRTVIHFNRSSFYIGCKLRTQGRTIEEGMKLSEKEYAIHGGGFPIRVRGAEGIQGVIIVSGLPDYDDHGIIYKTVKAFVASQ